MAKSKKSAKKINIPIGDLDYVELAKIVKNKKNVGKISNEAYNEIENRIKPKVMYIVHQFYIPGCDKNDILQEALYALRFKAIIDYDRNKGNHGPYPFDNFAILCIRRHLSTLLKSSFQNKRRTLSTSISLDQDRNNDSDNKLFLFDILPTTDSNYLNMLEHKEYYKNLFDKLFDKLSKFEKKVFILYTKKYSYDQMKDMLNKSYRLKNSKKRVKIKSIDNALSRIKQKGREFFDKYDDQNN